MEKNDFEKMEVVDVIEIDYIRANGQRIHKMENVYQAPTGELYFLGFKYANILHLRDAVRYITNGATFEKVILDVDDL